MYNHKGLLIVISGFSGAGKGTVVKDIMNRYDYALSISATTRKPRVGEVHGEHYFFIEREDFEARIEKGQLLEWAKYCENYYGTPQDFVFEQMEAGKDVILEIEPQGALKVKEMYPEAILIFITAPTVKELKDRLVGRGTETLDVVNKRLQRAYEEVDMIDVYNYFVVNGEVKQCADDIHSFVTAEHHRPSRQLELREDIKEQFRQLLAPEA